MRSDQALRGQFGEIGDARLTVMAALMVADELAESAKKAQRLEKELATLHDARVAALCRLHGVRELWTADRDFGRFPGLAVRNPLVG